MHDSKNALSVQRLLAELAHTLKTMDDKDRQLAEAADPRGQPWLETWTNAFWETLCREWAAIDQWRMNKVLLLVRFVIREQFRLMFDRVVNDPANADAAVAKQVQVLEAWPLSPRERKVPDGLRLHVLDVWTDELTGQLTAAQKSVEEEEAENAESKKEAMVKVTKDFMEPVRIVGREALSKGVKMRAKETIKLADERLSG
jgi:ribosomal RNA-processing protein 1